MSFLGGFLLAALALFVYKLSQIGRRDPRLPPGPRTIPVLGNAHLIPTTGLAEKSGDGLRPIFSPN